MQLAFENLKYSTRNQGTVKQTAVKILHFCRPTKSANQHVVKCIIL